MMRAQSHSVKLVKSAILPALLAVLLLCASSCRSKPKNDGRTDQKKNPPAKPNHKQKPTPAPEVKHQVLESADPEPPDYSRKAPPLEPVPRDLVFHADRTRPRVAITFDACQSKTPSGFDRAIWDVLMQKQAKATIFLGGLWMESNPDETRMIGASPLIEIGNHSYFHPDFRKISREKISEEIHHTQDIQWALTGKQGRVFRFPFGYYDQRSMKVVADLGLHQIQWEVTSGDPDPKMTADRLKRAVLPNLKNGSIIIFHINNRGRHTAEALPDIIDGLRERGFELVTVSELLGDEGPPAAFGQGAEKIPTAR